MMTNTRRTHWMIRGLGVSLLGGLGVSLLPSLVSGAYPLPGPDPRCNKCPDGYCVPNRFTYGYYAPKWRRWPGAGLGPETIPTPTEKAPEQDDTHPAQDDSNKKGRDDRSQQEPSGAQREQTSPDASTMPDIPEADVPGTVRPGARSGQQELPTPTIDQDLQNILEDDGPQSPPSDIPLLPETDTSPMPQDAPIQGIPAEDDPFKDDAPQSLLHRSTRGKQASAEESLTGALAVRRKAAKVHWRSEPQTAAEPPVGSKELGFTDRAIKPAAAIEREAVSQDAANPLRRSQSSSEEPVHTATSAVWRTNPLR